MHVVRPAYYRWAWRDYEDVAFKEIRSGRGAVTILLENSSGRTRPRRGARRRQRETRMDVSTYSYLFARGLGPCRQHGVLVHVSSQKKRGNEEGLRGRSPLPARIRKRRALKQQWQKVENRPKSWMEPPEAPRASCFRGSVLSIQPCASRCFSCCP